MRLHKFSNSRASSKSAAKGAISLMRRFGAERDGNIAIIFVFMLGVLMLFTGGAIDYSRYNAIRADLIESMDAAGLAMAQIDAVNGPEIENLSGAARDTYLKDYGRQFFHENFRYEEAVKNLTVDFTITAATISPNATGKIKTYFLDIGDTLVKFGSGTGEGSQFAYLDINTDTEITRRGSGKIELALVLDVTGSMGWTHNGEKKIDTLRDSVDNLLQVMYGDGNGNDGFIKVGVVPFNAHVNPGGASSWQNSWGDLNEEADYHGARFFHVNKKGNIAGLRKVNHYDLFNSVPNVDWMGCVEARPYPLDELDTVPGAAAVAGDITASIQSLTSAQEPNARMRLAFDRAPGFAPKLDGSGLYTAAELATTGNSRWVPMFAADEPDCFSSGAYCHGDWSDNEPYVDWEGNTVNQAMEGEYFHNPEDDGHDRRDYSNRYFIDDEDYADHDESGDYAARYARVVDKVRNNVGKTNNVGKLLTRLKITDKDVDEYKARMAYVGWWDNGQKKYLHKYNLDPSIDESVSDSDGSMRGPNKDCPAPILPLTSSRSDVEDHMELLFPYGNTNSANGAVWGWRVLSSQAPFTEGADEDNNEWQKAVVIMTDGVNTMSNRDTHYGSYPSAYGYEIEERMGDGVDRASRGNSGFDSDDMRDHLDEKFLRICRRMKKEGILVYTIVFALDDTATENVFKACATSPTEPYYYKAPSANQLEAAFGNIAQDLVDLHVSR